MFGTRTYTLFFLLFAFAIAEARPVSAGDMKFLFFGSSHCTACVGIKPRIDALRDKGNWPITYIDADVDIQQAQKFQIQSLPTFVLLIDGKEFDRFIGGADPKIVEEKILDLHARAIEFLKSSSSSALSSASPVSTFAPAPSFSQNPPQNAQIAQPIPSTGGNEVGPKPKNRYIAASVRIRANDPTGLSTGTGTIIDTRDGEALILTCAHIFRDSQGQGPVDLDLFLDSGIVKAQGQCVNFDLENDIAFVKFTVPQNAVIRAIPLATKDTLRNDQTLISVGCDGGADPTIRQHRVISLDRCSTPGNYRRPFNYIQVSGAPTQGRSGGGLFSADGYLVGVCNTGDPNSNDGHFVPLSVVRNQLDQISMGVVYQSPILSNSPASVSESTPPAGISLASVNGPVADNPLKNANLPADSSPTASYQFLTPEERATVEEIRRRQSEGAEVILIINPVKQGNEKPQSDIIKLENVSSKFLDVILEKDKIADQKAKHPTLTEQAAAMTRRPIAAPGNSAGRQRETGLRTQK